MVVVVGGGEGGGEPLAFHSGQVKQNRQSKETINKVTGNKQCQQGKIKMARHQFFLKVFSFKMVHNPRLGFT